MSCSCSGQNLVKNTEQNMLGTLASPEGKQEVSVHLAVSRLLTCSQTISWNKQIPLLLLEIPHVLLSNLLWKCRDECWKWDDDLTEYECTAFASSNCKKFASKFICKIDSNCHSNRENQKRMSNVMNYNLTHKTKFGFHQVSCSEKLYPCNMHA